MRPVLALPFTILSSPNQVRLLAGEDFRYTLHGPNLESWLPSWLALFDGRRTLDELLTLQPEQLRSSARQLVERLVGERVLVDGPAASAFTPDVAGWQVEGMGTLADKLRNGQSTTAGISVFCQDSLDYHAALAFNRRCRDEKRKWLWASCGPLSRGYVSPLFLPDAGPCLACLLSSFRRLSPVPELYDDLIQHAQAGGSVTPSPASAHLLEVLRALIGWKMDLVKESPPSSALFRLHVVEAATLEVSSQRVFVDPECNVCRERR